MTCLVYIDDIITFASSFDQHLERLDEVFARIAKANLKLKPSKCSLFQRQVEFLGHVVSEKGIAMQKEKIEAIETWPSPTNLTELRAFMGTCGYYRRFVKDFSSIAAPLFRLMKKGVKWEWTAECETVFVRLKVKLTSEPILALPTNEGTFVLDTDASDFGLGAVLSQIQNDEERVIAYASRTLAKPELKYEVTRKELLAIVFGLKQFRQYLLGRHIVIRTDHAALSWLRRTPEPLPQLARWMTFIEQFDYEVHHREGRKHGNADGLSRRPVVNEAQVTEDRNEGSCSKNEENEASEPKIRTLELTDSVSAKVREPPHEHSPATDELASLQQQQRSDEVLGRIIHLRLASGKVPTHEELSVESEVTKKLCLLWENLEVHEGLVYRKFRNRRKGEPDYIQLLVPRSHVENVLRQSHAGKVGGHFGIRKTQDLVQRRYYWPSWKEDTKRFCRSCNECNTYHRGRPPKQGPLKPVLAGAPFERWYIDLTGPHPKSAKGNIWILTCMDGFSKWCEAFPLRNKEAVTIAKTLVERVFLRLGCPLSILSDQGKEVDGRIMNEVCRLFEIEKLRTTPYKPSTNQVERFHKTMNSILAKTVDEHQRDWDEQLPFVMAAYRATRHEGTNYSPNLLVLGREVRVPLDLMYGPPGEDVENYDSFVEERRTRMTSAFAEVRSTLRQNAERNKRYYNLSVKPKVYEAGQWVWYFNLRKFRGTQMKWRRQYEGPYLVLRVLSPLTVEIQKSAKARSRTVHVDKLREFVGEPPKSWLATSAAPEVDECLKNTPQVKVEASSETGVLFSTTDEYSDVEMNTTSPISKGSGPKLNGTELELEFASQAIESSNAGREAMSAVSNGKDFAMANIANLPSTDQPIDTEFATAKSGEILGETQSVSNARQHLERDRKMPARYSGFVINNTKQPRSPLAKHAKPAKPARLGLVKVQNIRDGSCVKVGSKLSNQRVVSATNSGATAANSAQQHEHTLGCLHHSYVPSTESARLLPDRYKRGQACRLTPHHIRNSTGEHRLRMVRTKQTNRKSEARGLQRATKLAADQPVELASEKPAAGTSTTKPVTDPPAEFVLKKKPAKKPHARTGGTCSSCGRDFSQQTNLKRHMGVVHQLHLDGTPIDDTTQRRYFAYNQKGATKPTKTKPEAALGKAPTSEPHETSSDAEFITEDEIYTDVEIDDEKEKPDPPSTPKPSTTVVLTTNTPSDIGLVSKPMRPAKPYSSIRKLRKEISVPIAVPKPVQSTIRPRRTTEIRPPTVADLEAQNEGQSSREVAEIMRAKYDLTASEVKTKINQVRTARQARRAFARRIRSNFRIDGTKKTRREFLEWLEQTCRQVETFDSDEYEA